MPTAAAMPHAAAAAAGFAPPAPCARALPLPQPLRGARVRAPPCPRARAAPRARTPTMLRERHWKPADADAHAHAHAPAAAHAHMPEPLDALHSRLGILPLWGSHHGGDAAAAVAAPRLVVPPSHDLRLRPDPDHDHERGRDHDAGQEQAAPAADDRFVAAAPALPRDSAPPPSPWDTTSGAQALTLLGRRVLSLRRRSALLTRSHDECRRITALFSKTFSLGTSLLSVQKQRAVNAIYVWCRRTDDLVDGPRVVQRDERLRDVLADWERRLDEIFAGRARDALDLALVDALAKFPDITPEPFRDMIRGMYMDVDQDRYETFDELYLYCYRVAGTVGLMTLPVMGTVRGGRDGLRDAVEPALALGIGLQLTNILRDVGEDRLRGRIYLPREDLARFNYSEQDLFNCVLDNRYRNLIKFQIARARRYFRQAQSGVELLSADSRLPVQASLDMYSQILDVLERNGYDNLNRRAYVSKTGKVLTLPLSYLRTREDVRWKPVLRAAEFVMGDKNNFST